MPTHAAAHGVHSNTLHQSSPAGVNSEPPVPDRLEHHPPLRRRQSSGSLATRHAGQASAPSARRPNSAFTSYRSSSPIYPSSLSRSSPSHSLSFAHTHLISPSRSSTSSPYQHLNAPPSARYSSHPSSKGSTGSRVEFSALSSDPGLDEKSSVHHDVWSEVIMAIDIDKDGRVGCAYYIAMDEALYIEEDVALGGTEAVDTLLLRVQPTTVIIPNRAPGPLVELLEKDARGLNDEESGHAQGAYILRHVASAEFDYDAAREALSGLDLGASTPDPLEVLPAEDEQVSCLASARHGNLVRLAESVDFDSHVAVGCAGAVLGDVDRRRSAEDLYPDAAEPMAFRVLAIIMNTPDDTMVLSADALISLQILHSELHPNPQARYSNSAESTSKESLSVYGLVQALSCTAQGKMKLRQMLLRPTTDIDIILQRQNTIAILLRSENREVVAEIRKFLRRIKNTKSLLRYVRTGIDRIRGQLSIRTGEWGALLRFLVASIGLHHLVRSIASNYRAEILTKICENVDQRALHTLAGSISETFNLELSKETGHAEIQAGASDRLDDLNGILMHVHRMLPGVKSTIQKEVPGWAASYIQYCILLPELGFFIAVSLDPETGEALYNGEDAIDQDWELVFIKDDLAFFKTAAMLRLDSDYGQLPSQIAEEEINVVLRLAVKVLENERSILTASELFGELDSLLALARSAEEYGWTAPRMTLSNIVEISEGRHPLQELLVPTFIPNDCSLAGGQGGDGMVEVVGRRQEETQQPSMLILTGPNNSGKSIYMKQVAIIVYLAHIGSYVPATSATIGVTDRILTRIATRETVMDDESAFLVDLKQAAFTLNFATRRSLIIADEFGKGTSTETGSAIFAAYLTHLLDLAEERPKVLVGTHFHAVFNHGLVESKDGVEFAHMDAQLHLEAEDVEDRITFLYELVPGRDESSLGPLCAALNDVGSDVGDRAQQLVYWQNTNEELTVLCESPSDDEIDKLRPAELVARGFLEMEIPRGGDGRDRPASVRDMLGELLTLANTKEDVKPSMDEREAAMELFTDVDDTMDTDSDL